MADRRDMAPSIGALDQHLATMRQICGEILLQDVPTKQPSIVRAGAVVGLELFDALLNPDHIVRATEVLTLRGAQTFGRQYSIDVSLDRLSGEKEDGAAQLSALISERLVADGRPDNPGNARLWIPLLTVPRPVSVPIDVMGTDGQRVPRPLQREVRTALKAALYHILRESLRAHPDFDKSGSAVNTLMRQDETGRWLLQEALLEVCERGPRSRRSIERQQRLPREVSEVDGFRGAMTRLRLTEDNEHRRAALAVLAEVLFYDRPFVELVGLVHRNYFVVAGLDRSIRDQSLHFSMPDAQAIQDSRLRETVVSNRRALDPREHNYSIHVRLPAPADLREYRLHVTAPSDHDVSHPGQISLVAAVRFRGHPDALTLARLEACRDLLDPDSALEVPCLDGTPGLVSIRPSSDTAQPLGAERDHLVVAYVARQAITALDDLLDIIEERKRTAEGLSTRWNQSGAGSTRKFVSRTFGNLVDAAKQAEGKIAAAQQQLAGATSSRSTADLVTAASAAAEAVAEAVSAARHPLLSFELAGEEAPGSEVGALRRGRSGKAVSRPDQIEVWATVSDESRPYALAAIVAPLGLVSLVYIIGSLLLQSLDWPYSPVRIDVASDFAVAADAVVAVLLLFPGLALSQFRFPYRSSVTGRLRKAARLFVLTTAVGLCILAGVIATKVNTGASPDDVDVVVWTFRGTLAAFLMWLAWSLAAWAIRKWFVWRPKGLRALFDAGRLDGLPVSRRAIERIRTVLSFNQKAADADFDLTQGTGMSRKERR